MTAHSWWTSLSNSTLRDQSSDGLDVDQSERGCWGQAWRDALTAALGQTFSIRDVAAEGDCDWGTCQYKTARTNPKRVKGFGQDRQLRLSPDDHLSQIQRYAPQVKPS